MNNPVPSQEGVNAKATKKHLLEIARRLEVRGRSTMTKAELVEAIKKQNRRGQRGWPNLSALRGEYRGRGHVSGKAAWVVEFDDCAQRAKHIPRAGNAGSAGRVR